MSVTRNIVATYRGPGRVVSHLLKMGKREDRALAMLMAGCVIVFVSYWPALARQAHLEGESLEKLMTNALFAWVFLAPLLLYGAAALSHLGARMLGGRGSGFASRLVLFWALLASGPLLLLHGLTLGFLGTGPAQQIVGFLWFACFAWFWIWGYFTVHWRGQDDPA